MLARAGSRTALVARGLYPSVAVTAAALSHSPSIHHTPRSRAPPSHCSALRSFSAGTWRGTAVPQGAMLAHIPEVASFEANLAAGRFAPAASDIARASQILASFPMPGVTLDLHLRQAKLAQAEGRFPAEAASLARALLLLPADPAAPAESVETAEAPVAAVAGAPSAAARAPEADCVLAFSSPLVNELRSSASAENESDSPHYATTRLALIGAPAPTPLAALRLALTQALTLALARAGRLSEALQLASAALTLETQTRGDVSTPSKGAEAWYATSQLLSLVGSVLGELAAAPRPPRPAGPTAAAPEVGDSVAVLERALTAAAIAKACAGFSPAPAAAPASASAPAAPAAPAVEPATTSAKKPFSLSTTKVRASADGAAPAAPVAAAQPEPEPVPEPATAAPVYPPLNRMRFDLVAAFTGSLNDAASASASPESITGRSTATGLPLYVMPDDLWARVVTLAPAVGVAPAVVAAALRAHTAAIATALAPMAAMPAAAGAKLAAGGPPIGCPVAKAVRGSGAVSEAVTAATASAAVAAAAAGKNGVRAVGPWQVTATLDAAAEVHKLLSSLAAALSITLPVETTAAGNAPVTAPFDALLAPHTSVSTPSTAAVGSEAWLVARELRASATRWWASVAALSAHTVAGLGDVKPDGASDVAVPSTAMVNDIIVATAADSGKADIQAEAGQKVPLLHVTAYGPRSPALAFALRSDSFAALSNALSVTRCLFSDALVLTGAQIPQNAAAAAAAEAEKAGQDAAAASAAAVAAAGFTPKDPKAATELIAQAPMRMAEALVSLAGAAADMDPVSAEGLFRGAEKQAKLMTKNAHAGDVSMTLVLSHARLLSRLSWNATSRTTETLSLIASARALGWDAAAAAGRPTAATARVPVGYVVASPAAQAAAAATVLTSHDAVAPTSKAAAAEERESFLAALATAAGGKAVKAELFERPEILCGPGSGAIQRFAI